MEALSHIGARRASSSWLLTAVASLWHRHRADAALVVAALAGAKLVDAS